MLHVVVGSLKSFVCFYVLGVGMVKQHVVYVPSRLGPLLFILPRNVCSAVRVPLHLPLPRHRLNLLSPLRIVVGPLGAFTILCSTVLVPILHALLLGEMVMHPLLLLLIGLTICRPPDRIEETITGVRAAMTNRIKGNNLRKMFRTPFRYPGRRRRLILLTSIVLGACVIVRLVRKGPSRVTCCVTLVINLTIM